MRKKLPLILTLLGGAVGFALRKWQLTAGFEPDTRLPIPGAPSALLLVALSVVIAAGLLLLLWPGKGSAPAEVAFSAARDNTLYLTAAVLAGFLLLLSTGFELFTFTSAYGAAGEDVNQVSRVASMVLPPLRILFCVVGLPCTLLWARKLYRGGDVREQLPLLELCLLFCLWLITDYQSRAADPIIMDYVYEVFAIVCSLLGLYYLAGWSFQTGKPRRTIFFCLMGVYFSLVTLADAHTGAEMARLGFAVLFLTAHAALLLHRPAYTEDENGAPDAETEAD